MGAARLLAKFWIAFCLFAGAHALAHALAGATAPELALTTIGTIVTLFVAMGLLFIGGFGAAAGGIAKLTAQSFAPGFNELVFVVFAAAIYAIQVVIAPGQPPGGMLGALGAAVHYAVPGQAALAARLAACHVDGGTVFASAASWLAAFVFLGSAASRIRLHAGLLRLERKTRGASLGAVPLTFTLGLIAVIGIQFLFVGTLYALLPCAALSSLSGAVLIGLGPLALAYLIAAAITNLLALSPEA
ncbi:MAG TPA: hypothetical protein VMH86_10695 [Rhizomicrobium sp.]|nr:hypothetical protein [Rhizomicrobium sp.]